MGDERMGDELPLLLRVAEAREILGSVGRDTIYELVRSGRLRAVRLGRKVLIPRGELEHFIERELERDGAGLPARSDA